MEDQQPAAGDLKQIPGDDQTEAAAATQTDETKSEETAESTAAAETAEDEAAQADSDSASEVATESPKVAKRRKKRNWAAALAALAAVVFVGSAAFAGWAVQPYLTDRAVAATKLKVARTAADAITALWTYTPENMDNLADRAAAYLSGDFGAQYRKFVDAIVAPTSRPRSPTAPLSPASPSKPRGLERGGDGVHQHHFDQPADQEHSVAEVPVLPVVHETRRLPLAGDQDDHDHLARLDAAPVAPGQARTAWPSHPRSRSG